uniref:Cell wall protein PRY3-like isoform X2 n=1 Tax=Crassostrea virginica TaxID=6565 RepID=A0A8B8DFC4_CRAVI|nr:cell wall protein PRY3-like isoform X2 [Crassostrea virginica]
MYSSGFRVRVRQSGISNQRNDERFTDDVIRYHNDYRKKHGVQPLTHSPELSAQAQRWAEVLAQTNTFKHSNASIRGEKLGENIAMKWSSHQQDSYSGQEVTDQWYSEIKFYTFDREPSNLSAGHFTQIVWRGSREIGIGRARSPDGKLMVVANYRPAGNVIGRFTENVPSPCGPQSPRRLAADTGPSSKRENPRLTLHSNTPSDIRRQRMESKSTRTFTETTGSGANKVTKTVVEETIIKADGSKVTNRKETITRGEQGGASSSGPMMLERGRDKEKDDKKSKGGGMLGFLKGKDKKRDSSSSSSGSSQERVKKPQSLKAFIDECVKVHNTYRKKHGASSLSHAKDLSAFAQKWAEHLASTNSFQHSDCMHKGERLGENIACKWSSSGGDYSGKDVCDQWYSEISKHDFQNEPRSLGSGHFTQMVWKASKEIGVGKAKTSGGKVIVVASYRPAGNLVGSFTENVRPPK